MQPIDTEPDPGGPPPPTSAASGSAAADQRTTDPVTGLVMWHTVRQRLRDALDQPRSGHVGIVRCGVDRFEWINDAFGLDGGDEALRQIGAVLEQACPPPATVGRLGGDEFLVLLPTLFSAEDRTTVLEDLDRRFRSPLQVLRQEVFVSLSVGSATSAESTGSADASADQMLREASAAMREGKERRRGVRVEAWGVDLLRLDADLHHALDRGEIVAHFQPQYARTGELTGFEALARWQHPNLGTLTPDRFIPLAESNGLIGRLGDTVLEQACRFADRAFPGRPIQVEVNVSALQLSAPGLADRIAELLARSPDRTWSLTVEITESVLALDPPAVVAELERIRALGVGVAIDDFGVGYSSLSRLRELPVTELKIDRSFVQQEDAVGARLLAGIIDLAHALDLSVVAEGVETRSQLDSMRALGCERVQGMYLGPPVPVELALAAPTEAPA